MKALDLSQPQFYAPLKARVTFKTFPKAVNETPTVAAMRARSSAAPVVAPTRARAPHPTQAMARAVRSQIELEIARLSQARTAHVKHALQQIARRSEDLTHDDGKLSERAIDTLCRELTHELQKSSPSVANSNWQGELQGLTREQAMARSEVRSLHALRLIAKIDGFIRTQRPTLSLTLNDSLAVRVDIERVGPGEVALRLVGRDGPPSPEAVTRIREEMEAKGLKIAVLAVE